MPRRSIARAGSGTPNVSASAQARSAAAIASPYVPVRKCAEASCVWAATSVGPGVQLDKGRCLYCELDMAALAQYVRDLGELDQRPRFGLVLATGAEEVERLVERSRGLARAAGLEGGVRPAEEQLRPLRVVGRAELERAGEPRLRLGGVEAERPLPGEREKAAGRCGELFGLLGVAGGLGELECLQVVVG